MTTENKVLPFRQPRYPRGSFIVVPQAAPYDGRLSFAALRVLVMLQDHANGLGDLTFPGIKRMAGDLSVDLRTVQRALRLLERCGYLVTITRTKPGRGRTTNYYRVTFTDQSRPGMDAAPGRGADPASDHS